MTSDVLTAFSPGAEFLAIVTADGRVKVFRMLVVLACWHFTLRHLRGTGRKRENESRAGYCTGWPWNDFEHYDSGGKGQGVTNVRLSVIRGSRK